MIKQLFSRGKPKDEDPFLAGKPVPAADITESEPDGPRVSKKFLFLEGLGLLVLLPVIVLLFLYRDVRPVVRAEYTGGAPSGLLFSKNGIEAEYGVSGAEFPAPGRYLAKVKTGRSSRLSLLEIRDTVAPQAEFLPLTLGVGEQVTADKCIKNLTDAQKVAVSFVNKPDFYTEGTQTVSVKLKDMSGNTSVVTGELTVAALRCGSMVLEAGDPFPPLSAFVYGSAENARFATPEQELTAGTPGEQDVAIEIAGKPYICRVSVRDTRAPRVKTRAVFLNPGEQAAPEDFLEKVEDATAWTAEFTSAPDYASRELQTVSLAVTDAGGNTAACEAELLISPIAPVTVEADGKYLRGAELGEGVRILTDLKLDSVGTYKLKCLLDGEEYYALVAVQDTVAPVVRVKKGEAHLHVKADPKCIIASAQDATGVLYSFAEEPDPDIEGEQAVTVLCIDEGGNVTKVEGVIDFTPDTVPPVIYCPDVTYCYIGETVAYFASVEAEDDRGGEVTLTVDNSAVNIYEAGSYPVTYRAADAAGNVSEETVRFVLIEPGVTQEAYDDAVNTLYNKIIRDDMTMGEKGKAIFDWVHRKMSYRARSNKKDWRYEAWRGITYKAGDCFTFCAAARALLEKAGARVMVVTRYGGYAGTHHWWLLVDLGTGYYHFDPINNGAGKHYECFMRTDAEVKKKNRMFWAFDTTLYPATPTEKFDINGR